MKDCIDIVVRCCQAEILFLGLRTYLLVRIHDSANSRPVQGRSALRIAFFRNTAHTYLCLTFVCFVDTEPKKEQKATLQLM